MNNTLELENFAYSIRRYFVDQFYIQKVAQIADGSRVLDLGGTKILKRGKFDIEKYNLNVVYANLITNKKPDVQADVAFIPFKASSFDVIICSELLEHIAEPRYVLEESYRVLRDGGIMLICTPFLFRVHADPYDYARYTDYYWRTFLSQVGFREIMVENQGGYFAVMVDNLKTYMLKVGCQAPFRNLKTKMIIALLHWMWRQEHKPKNQNHEILKSYTTGYGVVAIK